MIKIAASIEDKLSGIYCLKNEITGKRYVGQSINIRSRIYTHKSEASKGTETSSLLYNSIRKYGWENFSCEILEKVDTKKLDEREIYWIKFYDTVNIGYNLDEGGFHRLHSDERKKRIALSKIGFKHSEKTKRLISESIKGTKQSVEHIEKRKLSRKNTLSNRPKPPKFFLKNSEIVKKTRKKRLGYKRPDQSLFMKNNNPTKGKKAYNNGLKTFYFLENKQPLGFIKGMAPRKKMNNFDYNAFKKDALENRLHALVCDKTITLDDAQTMIRTDWIGAYKKYVEVN